MAIELHDQHDIALAQLETAFRLFAEGNDFYSVITLAGAADEIFGRLLSHRGGVTALASLTKAAKAIQVIIGGSPADEKVFVERANRARNAMKHLNQSGQKVVLDSRQEAIDMLERAISNYWELSSSLTPLMVAFQQSQRDT